MLKFKKETNRVILSYTSEQSSEKWVYDKLDKPESVTLLKPFTVSKSKSLTMYDENDELTESGSVTLSGIFTVSKNELLTKYDEDGEYTAVEFEVAKKVGTYYQYPKEILSTENDVYIDENINLEKKTFIAVRGIAIFPKIDEMINSSVYIGGNNENSIPIDIYKSLLQSFPTTYEMNRYASARISSVLSSYIDTKEDYEEKYQKYLNKKISRKGKNLQLDLSGIEEQKYIFILEKLKDMLNNETSYTESQWQEELLQIILLLYPKYIHVFKEVSVRDTYNNINRKIDYLLIDSSGNTDIIEIKKPFDKCIVTERTYRNNYIPLRELSGTVMQIEKYIFCLNRWGKKGEEKLTAFYKDELAPDFNIKITNPNGIIIMGRKEGLTKDQLQDFEVIKRKYKNVIDIVTYDDLIERLEFTIKQWSNTHNKFIQATTSAST